MDFEGKNVLVTGASSGLGETIAVKFAQTKINMLIITGRNKERLEAVQAKCKEACEKTLAFVCDMSIPAEVEKLVAFVEKETEGKLNVFIGNHGSGGTHFQPVTAMGEGEFDNFDKVMETNFMSMVRLTNSLARIMPEKGSIVYVTSVNSTMPCACGAAYCCSKASLMMFMKCAALDLGSKQIRVNSVAPGYIDTPFQAQFFGGDQKVQTEKLNEIGKKAPLGRIASKDGIANTIMFFASDLAIDITGTEHVVDGGALLMYGAA